MKDSRKNSGVVGQCLVEDEEKQEMWKTRFKNGMTFWVDDEGILYVEHFNTDAKHLGTYSMKMRPNDPGTMTVNEYGGPVQDFEKVA